MSRKIHFYFDFSSPYGYLASERIETLATRHGREVCWHPLLLGAVFKTTGERPLMEIPLVDAYTPYDLDRCSREHGLLYRHPARFPLATVAACRGFYWIDTAAPELATAYVHAVLRAYFCHGAAIDEPAVVSEIAATVGADAEAFVRGINTSEVKARTRAAIEEAVALGVFGSPMMVVGQERFFGNDRLGQLDRWLSSGGW